MEELDTGLQRVVVLALLDQERGSSRLASRRGVNLGREGSQKESRMVANFSSSLHSKSRVSLLLLWFNASGGSWRSGRDK
jgi:hypothetical protein